MFIYECAYCGTENKAKRSSAKYCDTSCRVAHHRMLKRVKMLHQRAIDSVAELARIRGEHPQTAAVECNGAIVSILGNAGYFVGVSNFDLLALKKGIPVTFQHELEWA